MYVNVRTSDRVIVQYSDRPVDMPGTISEILSDAEWQRVVDAYAQGPSGGIVLSVDHATVSRLASPAVDPALTEKQTAISDVQQSYTTAIARLDDINTNGPAYTATQVRQAVLDMAVIQRRVLRALRDLLV